MGRVSWIIQGGPKCNQIYVYERKAEGDFSQQKKRQHDHRGRDWSDATTIQGMPPGGGEGKEQILP